LLRYYLTTFKNEGRFKWGVNKKTGFKQFPPKGVNLEIVKKGGITLIRVIWEQERVFTKGADLILSCQPPGKVFIKGAQVV